MLIFDVPVSIFCYKCREVKRQFFGCNKSVVNKSFSYLLCDGDCVVRVGNIVPFKYNYLVFIFLCSLMYLVGQNQNIYHYNLYFRFTPITKTSQEITMEALKLKWNFWIYIEWNFIKISTTYFLTNK